MSPRPQKKLRASFNLADDMEQLQLINTMVSAQEMLYPGMRKHFQKEYTAVIHREFWVNFEIHHSFDVFMMKNQIKNVIVIHREFWVNFEIHF